MTSSMAKNAAAWALKPKTRPLTVSSAPYTSPPKHYLVIKVTDVAINPIDWILQDQDIFDLDYPAILGYDIAGEVHAIGEGVEGFEIGRKVIAICTQPPSPASTTIPTTTLPPHTYGAFQRYALVHMHTLSALPPSISTTHAVVLPLSITTAAAGLYQRDYLSLPPPQLRSHNLPPQLNPFIPATVSSNRVLLIWGGSSSVGSSAIQLAVASGVSVITTASPRNFEYCRALGASSVFDYHDADVEDAIVEAVGAERTLVGAFHAQGDDEAVRACARVVERARGKTVVVTVRGRPEEGVPACVRVKMIEATDVFGNEVGKRIWRDFLPRALEDGTIVPNPPPQVVGRELRSIQLGMDMQKKGVSASKIVVSCMS